MDRIAFTIVNSNEVRVTLGFKDLGCIDRITEHSPCYYDTSTERIDDFTASELRQIADKLDELNGTTNTTNNMASKL